MKRSRAFAFRVLLALASALSALLLLEAAIRLLVPEPLWRFRDASLDWRPDPAAGWVQRPNLDVTKRSDQGWTVRFQTNEDGLTPASTRRRKPAGVVRILIVGDSAVVGRGVPQDRTIHSFLQRELAAQGRAVEVLNAGVEGYSTDQALVRMRELLPRYRPDIVAYGFCGNDFGGNEVGDAYGVPKPRFVLEAGRLRELKPDPSAARGFATQGSGPRRWIQYSAVYRLLHPWILGLRARLGGWQRENLLSPAPEIFYDPAALDQVDWPLFAALLREMRATAQRHGARFFFYPHPDIAEVWDPFIRSSEQRRGLAPGQYDRFAVQKRLRRVAQASSVPFCSVIEHFIAEQDRGPFHLLPRDPHCNPRGYEVTAEALSRCLLGSGMLGSAEPSVR